MPSLPIHVCGLDRSLQPASNETSTCISACTWAEYVANVRMDNKIVQYHQFHDTIVNVHDTKCG